MPLYGNSPGPGHMYVLLFTAYTQRTAEDNVQDQTTWTNRFREIVCDMT